MPQPPSIPRLYLLANPAAGRGRGAGALATAVALLKQRGQSPAVLATERPQHAIELAARAAAEDAGLLLVLGGDGTFRDAVQGLEGSGVPVGLLPGGTGNDLARTLGIPNSLEGALDVALSGRERELDVWRWNNTVFVNVAGLGLDAAVAETTNRRFPHLRGTLAYLAAFAATLPGFRPFALSLEWPGGQWAGKAWLAAFANAVCYGGGMRIAPEAVPDDGLLDVIVVEDVSRAELLRQFPGIFAGRHVQHPRVRSFRLESVRIEAPTQHATIDGELLETVPAVIERLPWKVRVRVPG